LPKVINSFSGEYNWLSNFYPSKIYLYGVEYPSVENAFQAAKTVPGLRPKFVTCSARQAKWYGRSCSLREDWEDIKVETMRSLVDQKFWPGTPLAEKLKATGTAVLIEENTWGDTFWGVCNDKDKNQLGLLLMNCRRVLLKEFQGGNSDVL
jgi:ribA/ribD-fused uncharacterized protein